MNNYVVTAHKASAVLHTAVSWICSGFYFVFGIVCKNVLKEEREGWREGGREEDLNEGE